VTARLTADFWVAAYLARLGHEGIYAHVAHKGDPTAGAIAVKVATMDGRATLFMRHYDGEGRRVWSTVLDQAPEREVDNYAARQRSFDRDLWVIEVEDPRGRHMLDRDELS
jgi:hypothetical protein